MTILRHVVAGAISLLLAIPAGCAPTDDPPTAARATTSSSSPTTTHPATTTTTPSPVTTTTMPAPPPPAPKGPRPPSGKSLLRQGPSGRGSLKVENGNSTDAVVTLVRDGRPVRAMYVRASENATLSGVADGTYDIYYASGTGWNVDLRIFTAQAAYFKFDDPARFTTTRVSNGVRYTTYRLTLHAVPDGRASRTSVSADAYPH